MLEMEVEVGNKVSDRQRIISMSAQSCNQMQIGLFSSPNELSIDVRLDLQAGRATVHAACGRFSTSDKVHPQVRFGMISELTNVHTVGRRLS